jgi:hypothetical protein
MWCNRLLKIASMSMTTNIYTSACDGAPRPRPARDPPTWMDSMLAQCIGKPGDKAR